MYTIVFYSVLNLYNNRISTPYWDRGPSKISHHIVRNMYKFSDLKTSFTSNLQVIHISLYSCECSSSSNIYDVFLNYVSAVFSFNIIALTMYFFHLTNTNTGIKLCSRLVYVEKEIQVQTICVKKQSHCQQLY